MLFTFSRVRQLFVSSEKARATIGVLAISIFAAAALVYASIPDSGGVIHGCYKPGTGRGTLREAASFF